MLETLTIILLIVTIIALVVTLGGLAFILITYWAYINDAKKRAAESYEKL